MVAVWPSRSKGLNSIPVWLKSNKINTVEDREVRQKYTRKPQKSSGSRFLLWFSLLKFQGPHLSHRLANMHAHQERPSVEVTRPARCWVLSDGKDMGRECQEEYTFS